MYYTVADGEGLAIWAGLSPENPELDINRQFVAWVGDAVAAQALIDRLRQADRLNGAHGLVMWKADDVMDRFGWSHEQANNYLESIDSALTTAQVEKGWDIIDFWREECAAGDPQPPYGHPG